MDSQSDIQKYTQALAKIQMLIAYLSFPDRHMLHHATTPSET
jgi:hypothetical protein